MLDKITSTFQGFFSRSFWFGSFLPVAIVVAVHLLIGWLYDPRSVPLGEWAQAKFESLALSPVAFVGLVVLAYALTPLIPLLRGVLDGSLLPLWLHDWVRREHVMCARAARDEITAAQETLAALERMAKADVARLQKAYPLGMATGALTDPGLITAATHQVEALQRQLDFGATPTAAGMSSAVDALEAALRTNASRVAAGSANEGFAKQLAQTHKLMLKLLRQAQMEAEHRCETLYSRNRILLAIKNPNATRMADARVFIESYSNTVYQADFDYIWPRLQLVLSPPSTQGSQENFADLFAAARSQVDFAVLSLALVLTVPVVWLPLLALTADSPWLFLTIGITAPFLIRFFYELAVQSQIAFGEAVKAAIDDKRIDLLKRLRQPVPATRAAERGLWKKLRYAEQAADRFDLVYRHPPDSAGEKA